MKRRIVVLSFCAACSLKGEIILSEIMFNPAGSEYTDEFVEIYNRGDCPVSLDGWQIGDSTGDDVLINAGFGMVIHPGRYGLIFDRDYLETSNVYQSLIPDSSLILIIDGSTIGSGGLSNSQPETVVLSDKSGRVADSHTYTIDNSSGYSDERIDLFEDLEHANWANSLLLNGTPGYQNSVAKRGFDLAVISLFSDAYQINSDSFLFHARIQNIGRFDIPDFNVQFFYDANSDSVQQTEERLSGVNGLKLSAGGSCEASAEWPNPPSGCHTVGIFVDFARDEDLSNNQKFIQIDIPYTIRSVIINEVMANPLSGWPEWIELFVIEDDIINLDGWSIMDKDSNLPCPLSCSRNTRIPSQYYIISEDASLSEQFPFIQSPIMVPEQFPGLNNTGDSISILDPSGHCVDCMHYTQDQVEDPGVSLERIHIQGASDDPQNWLPSTAFEGATPGAENSVHTETIPSSIKLSVTPDPFSPDGDGFEDRVCIEYIIPAEYARIRLLIFDVRGRCIRTLLNGALSGARRSIFWDGLDDLGNSVRMGIYICYFEAIDHSTGKVWHGKNTVVLAGRL